MYLSLKLHGLFEQYAYNFEQPFSTNRDFVEEYGGKPKCLLKMMPRSSSKR